VHGCTARPPIASTPLTLPPSARKCPPIKPQPPLPRLSFPLCPRLREPEEIPRRSPPSPQASRDEYVAIGERRPSLSHLPLSLLAGTPSDTLRVLFSAGNQRNQPRPKLTGAYDDSSLLSVPRLDAIGGAVDTVVFTLTRSSSSRPRLRLRVAGASPTSTPWP
jgi:hypothetical protein